MAVQAVEPRSGSVILKFEPDHFAERLRIKRGGSLRVTGYAGVPENWSVDGISMPDANGYVTVYVSA